jgi:hypothetical protein
MFQAGIKFLLQGCDLGISQIPYLHNFAFRNSLLRTQKSSARSHLLPNPNPHLQLQLAHLRQIQCTLRTKPQFNCG